MNDALKPGHRLALTQAERAPACTFVIFGATGDLTRPPARAGALQPRPVEAFTLRTSESLGSAAPNRTRTHSERG